jgi:hypothetical protein
MRLFSLRTISASIAWVVLASSVTAVGTTLYGLLCGALYWVINSPDGWTVSPNGVAVAALGRFFFAGAVAGAIVGAFIAWDHAVNFGPEFQLPSRDGPARERRRPSPAEKSTFVTADRPRMLGLNGHR